MLARTPAPSVEGFTEWLGRQDPSATYSYWDDGNCAAAQYLRSVGTTYGDLLVTDRELISKLNWVASQGSMGANPCTFGGAHRFALTGAQPCLQS